MSSMKFNCTAALACRCAASEQWRAELCELKCLKVIEQGRLSCNVIEHVKEPCAERRAQKC